jgi:hypothetical protein
VITASSGVASLDQRAQGFQTSATDMAHWISLPRPSATARSQAVSI